MLLFMAFWPTWADTAIPTVYLHWLESPPGNFTLRQLYDDDTWRDVPTVTSE